LIRRLYSLDEQENNTCSDGCNSIWRKKMENAKSQITNPRKYIVTDPPLAQALFGDVRLSWIWLIVRLYVGYEWLVAGWDKIINPAWVGANAGTALSGFLNNAISLTTGAHPAVQSWYAAFLKAIIAPATGFWSYVVAFGETLVGLGLILGVFTGIAAFFGFFMNMNYMLAGSISTNPILLFLSIFLILAWKTAGWWGLDRWVLIDLGTPWSPGLAFQPKSAEKQSAPTTEMKGSH
jgi:thiosulfate dehydrogenase [quinone] large subunit